MSVPVRCPTCHSLQAIPLADVQRPIRCVACGGLFVLPPGAAGSLVSAVAAPPHLRGGAAPLPPPVAGPARGGPPLNPWPEPALAANLPDSAAEEDAADDELTPGERRLRKAVLLMFLVVFLAAFCVVPVAISYLLRQPPATAKAPPELSQGGPIGPELELLILPPAKAGDPPWLSAATQRAARNGVVVQVERVEVGEVQVRNAAGQPEPAGPGEFFIVHLQLSTRSDARFPYASWYNNDFTYNGRVLRANLRDENDRRYPQQRFPQASAIRGHTPTGVVRKNEPVTDILVFAVPHAVIEGQGPLRLELPAGALGISGVFRFEISPQFRQGLKPQ